MILIVHHHKVGLEPVTRGDMQNTHVGRFNQQPGITGSHPTNSPQFFSRSLIIKLTNNIWIFHFSFIPKKEKEKKQI